MCRPLLCGGNRFNSHHWFLVMQADVVSFHFPPNPPLQRGATPAGRLRAPYLQRYAS